MGGEYNGHRIKCAESELQRAFQALADESRYESGHSYSGAIGMKRGLQIIRNTDAGYWAREAAESHCTEHNEKWGDAYAYAIGPGEWYVGEWCSS
jgi:hypothetical protein